MQPKTRMYLWDMLRACELLEEFTLGKTFDDYSSSAMLQSAVERQLAIIGEALNNILRADPLEAEKITDARKIISFRNVLIHGYRTLEPMTIWEVLESSLPVLHRELEALLDH
jgi:uncharacterized protein with HEPN domain